MSDLYDDGLRRYARDPAKKAHGKGELRSAESAAKNIIGTTEGSKIPKMSEEEFMKQIYQFAKLCGFKVAHFRPARVGPQIQKKFITPCQFDATGFPDLVLVSAKLQRVLFVEVKAELGKVSKLQEDWLERLALAGAEVFTWKPSDWDEIHRTLDPEGKFEFAPVKGVK